MQHIKTDTEDYYRDDNDEIHGEYKAWYDNGQLRLHHHYVHGKRHGEYKHWYNNGQLCSHCHYVHGEIHGEYKEWHYSGQLSRHFHFVHGDIHGEYKEWHSDGELSIHTYEVNHTVIHNLLEQSLSDEDKFEMQITYGGKWLCYT